MLRLDRRVTTVAVGGLDDHGARVGRIGARRQDRVRPSAEVAGEQHARLPRGSQDARRAEHVARRREHHTDASADLDLLAVGSRPEPGDGLVGVRHGVERQRRVVPGVPAGAGVLRVTLVQVRAVPQHDRRQRVRSRRQPHRSAEPVAHQHREVPAVVQVGMRDDNGVEGVRWHGERLPVEASPAPLPLVEAAVDEEAMTAVLQQERAAGHGPGTAQEREDRLPAVHVDLPSHAPVRLVPHRQAALRGRHATRAGGPGRARLGATSCRATTPVDRCGPPALSCAAPRGHRVENEVLGGVR